MGETFKISASKIYDSDDPSNRAGCARVDHTVKVWDVEKKFTTSISQIDSRSPVGDAYRVAKRAGQEKSVRTVLKDADACKALGLENTVYARYDSLDDFDAHIENATSAATFQDAIHILMLLGVEFEEKEHTVDVSPADEIESVAVSDFLISIKFAVKAYTLFDEIRPFKVLLDGCEDCFEKDGDGLTFTLNLPAKHAILLPRVEDDGGHDGKTRAIKFTSVSIKS